MGIGDAVDGETFGKCVAITIPVLILVLAYLLGNWRRARIPESATARARSARVGAMSLEASEHMEDARGRMDASDVSIHRWRRDVARAPRADFQTRERQEGGRGPEGAERARGSGSSARRWPESDKGGT